MYRLQLRMLIIATGIVAAAACQKKSDDNSGSTSGGEVKKVSDGAIQGEIDGKRFLFGSGHFDVMSDGKYGFYIEEDGKNQACAGDFANLNNLQFTIPATIGTYTFSSTSGGDAVVAVLVNDSNTSQPKIVVPAKSTIELTSVNSEKAIGTVFFDYDGNGTPELSGHFAAEKCPSTSSP